MFERIKSAKKLWNADKAAKQVVSFVAPCLFGVTDANGSLDATVRDDEFILAYAYGMMLSCAEVLNVNDQEERGYLVQQVFERMFPNNGKWFAAVCNQRVSEKNKTFMRRVQLGYTEMSQSFSSGGQKILTSLLDHVKDNYN